MSICGRKEVGWHMGLNETPSALRVHIGFFGRRNAGKSSIVNAITGQEISVVSDTLGTTTDPVFKAMELLPVGPVEIIDTPGFDDSGELGELRIKRTKQILNKTDVAVLVVDSQTGKTACDDELIRLFKEKEIPYIVVYNKSDLAQLTASEANSICVSAKEKINIYELKEKIAQLANKNQKEKRLLEGIVKPGDLVILVIPIDSAAPKGRLILPQQQTIREILDTGAFAACVRDTEYADFLKMSERKPNLVICDSQAFGRVNRETPQNILLTSFSILFARMKGNLKTVVEGVKTIDELSDGDTVLISEGCTHHRQCDDIGTVKLPKWLGEYTGKKLNFEFTSGIGFEDNLKKYKMIIHCGGCMLNEKEMQHRQKCAREQGIPITNYGTAIAYVNGILKRSMEVFPEFKDF